MSSLEISTLFLGIRIAPSLHIGPIQTSTVMHDNISFRASTSGVSFPSFHFDHIILIRSKGVVGSNCISSLVWLSMVFLYGRVCFQSVLWVGSRCIIQNAAPYSTAIFKLKYEISSIFIYLCDEKYIVTHHFPPKHTSFFPTILQGAVSSTWNTRQRFSFKWLHKQVHVNTP